METNGSLYNPICMLISIYNFQRLGLKLFTYTSSPKKEKGTDTQINTATPKRMNKISIKSKSIDVAKKELFPE